MDADVDTGLDLPRAVRDGAWAGKLAAMLQAGYAAIEVAGTEPRTALAAAAHAAARHAAPTLEWNIADGFRVVGDRPGLAEALAAEVARLGDEFRDPGLLSPLSAIRAVDALELPPCASGDGGSALVALVNFYPFFAEPAVAQTFDNLARRGLLSGVDDAGRPRRRPILFLHNPYAGLELRWVETVRHWITPHPLPLPDEAELLEEQVRRCVAAAGVAPPPEAELRVVAAALRGLSRYQAENALYYAVASAGGFTPGLPAAIRREAARAIAGATALEVVDESEIARPEDLAGVDAALEALDRAARSYTEAAAAEALDPAGGLYFAGLSGTGKSELCKAAAAVLERATGRAFTVLKVRMGALFGGIVGTTEANWYAVERVVAAFGPDTVVWLDEFDKAFGGVTEGRGDSGVRQGLFGLFLSWMSDPKRRCFVVAALNDPTGIPPETFRRFDAGFYFGLPDAAARGRILEIHAAKRLRRRGLDLAACGIDPAGWLALGELADGFIPAELERAVMMARDRAFAATGRAVPSAADLEAAIRELAPGRLALQKKEDFERLGKIRGLLPAAGPRPAAAAPARAAAAPRSLSLGGTGS